MPNIADIPDIPQIIYDARSISQILQNPAFPMNIPIPSMPPPSDNPVILPPAPAKPVDMTLPDMVYFWETVEITRDQLSEFDVSEFLSENELEEISSLLAAYESYLEFIGDDLGLQFDLSLFELEEVRRGYIDYLAALRVEIMRGEAYSQERLRENLDEVIAIKEDNIEDTHYLLSDFAGMMPTSRTSAGINRELVQCEV